MSDRIDTRMQAIVTELATAAPMAPPMPVLTHKPQRLPVGIGTAAAAFVAILVVAAVSVVGIMTMTSTDRVVGSSEIFIAAGGAPVAVVTEDGETLRGYLWQGSDDAIAMTTAYGESTADLIPFAVSTHAEGPTVMLVEPRGEGSSTGRADATLLPNDMKAVVRDLSTRGVESVTVVGFRHSATAAIVLATDPPPAVETVIAFFPFEQYQSLDAISVIDRTKVPITIVGASQPSELGPWAGHLIRDGGDLVTGTILRPLPSDEMFLDHYRDDILAIIRDGI